MRIFVCDAEVFTYDYLVIFKDILTGEYTVIHNNNFALKEVMNQKDIAFAFFNGKHYDQYIIKAICTGADNRIVKELNDFIIKGDQQGFEHYWIREHYFDFSVLDVRDDMQQGLSLKAIEGHLGVNIEESSVPFDIDRPLTEEELQETIHYCKHDVDTTEQLLKLRKPYLEGKLAIGRMKGIPDTKALYATNAKLTARFLEAKPLVRYDEREYEYPPNLKRELIPLEVFEFFDKMHDKSISDDEVFNSKIKIKIGDCPCVIAYGGIHGAIPNYIEENEELTKGQRVIRNYDVASLYPSLMINYGYTSRNIPSAESFESVYRNRLTAKKNGDKRTSDTLKLVLNTTYGGMLNQYNDLFDPLMGRSVCISGQLFLTELARAYIETCKTIKIIQINTDGITFSIDSDELNLIYSINDEWQSRTGFELEEDKIKKIIQKDVNNYIMVTLDGDIKVKGGYLTYGISKVGAWNINNNAVIVKKALADYFVKGTSVEDTINNCNNILEFQFIAKAGRKYKEAYHIVDGEKLSIQKVNRVYASKDDRYGKLYKVKTENDSEAKIESLPEHCIIDNDNHLSIEEVDKLFYIVMAHKRIDDFMGVKPKKIDRRKMNKLSKEILKLLEVG